MRRPILRAERLCIGYGSKQVLAEVSLEIGLGEFWFVLGTNGVGKTSFVRALLGLLEPRGGRLWRDPELAPRERIGFVPERADLHPTLPTTVREFVELGLVGLAVRRHERRERLREALSRAGLARMERASYWSLSGGMRQRALLARALIRRPTLLILDEPTSNLDPAMEEALLGLLARLRCGEGLTVLFVTHDIGFVNRYATHVALFRQRAVLAGERETIFTAENLRAVYGPEVPLPAGGWAGAAACGREQTGGGDR